MVWDLKGVDKASKPQRTWKSPLHHSPVCISRNSKTSEMQPAFKGEGPEFLSRYPRETMFSDNLEAAEYRGVPLPIFLPPHYVSGSLTAYSIPARTHSEALGISLALG